VVEFDDDLIILQSRAGENASHRSPTRRAGSVAPAAATKHADTERPTTKPLATKPPAAKPAAT